MTRQQRNARHILCLVVLHSALSAICPAALSPPPVNSDVGSALEGGRHGSALCGQNKRCLHRHTSVGEWLQDGGNTAGSNDLSARAAHEGVHTAERTAEGIACALPNPEQRTGTRLRRAEQAPAHWPTQALTPTTLPDVDDMVKTAGLTTDAPFLLIGVLSSQQTQRRRITVRKTWQQYMTHTPTHTVQLRFVLGHNEVRS